MASFVVCCEAEKRSPPPEKPKISPEQAEDLAVLDEMIAMMEKQVRADATGGKVKTRGKRIAAGYEQRNVDAAHSH